MLVSTRCIHGFMSNLIKKSWTDCMPQVQLKGVFPKSSGKNITPDLAKTKFGYQRFQLFETFSWRKFKIRRFNIGCFIWLFNKIDNLIFSSPKEHQGSINGSLVELAYKDKFLYILPLCEAHCCKSFTRDGSGGTKIWMIKWNKALVNKVHP